MNNFSLLISFLAVVVSQSKAINLQGRWTQWSGCSKSCGKGVSYREQLCNGPFACSGKKLETRACNQQPCSVLRAEPKPVLVRSGAVDLEYLDEKSIQKSFPWTVRVKCGLTTCLGSIISEKHVITSAKCVIATIFQYQVCRVKVIAGAPNSQFDLDPEIEYGRDIQIETAIKTTIHPDFNSRTFIENNIAVIELGTPLKLSSDFVSPICVGEAIPSVNCISLDLQTSSNTLSVVSMQGLSLGECQQMFGFWKVGYKRVIDQLNDDRTICTSKSRGSAFNCQGTSGSALMCQGRSGSWNLKGVTSYGDLRCGYSPRPAIHASIDHHRDWIEETTNTKFPSCL